jgi:hypothetical protein
MFDEMRAVLAFPLRVAGREMRADIAGTHAIRHRRPNGLRL